MAGLIVFGQAELRAVGARATAKRIPDFLEALDLRDVTLVGNDTGGGLCLAALGTERPGLERIGRFVLTNCDSTSVGGFRQAVPLDSNARADRSAVEGRIRPPRHPPARRTDPAPPQPGPEKPMTGAAKITRCLTGRSPSPLGRRAWLPVPASTSGPCRRRISSLVNGAMDPACGTSVAASLETA